MDENDDFEDLDIEFEEEEEVEEIKGKTPIKDKIPKGGLVTLVFRSTIGPGEKLEKMQVDSNMAVMELKVTVGQIFGLEPEAFHLSIAGRTLDSDDVLSNYDLEDGIEALIIPVSTAGK